MSSTAGRVFTGLTRLSAARGILSHNSIESIRLNGVRSIALSSQQLSRSRKSTDDEEVNNEPIKFSTSKASHRTWKVDRSMGSHFERPWWKVLPISLFATGFLLWCVLRNETDIDSQLEKQLYEHLPGLLSEEEQEQKQDAGLELKESLGWTPLFHCTSTGHQQMVKFLRDDNADANV
ncbi:hypothetical protein INR49_013746, partial [Caranx melampygus]